MEFSSLIYRRPVISDFKANFLTALKRFISAESFEEQDQAFLELNKVRDEFDSMYHLCHIRYTINTKDEFYEAENAFFDSNLPIYNDLIAQYYQALITSKFRKSLEKRWGSQLFTIAELTKRTFNADILSDLQMENKLSSEYTLLKASARIQFQDKEFNLSSIQPFEMSPNRTVRKDASQKKWQFYVKQAPKVEDIFDRMVKIRHRIAQKLGYKNFVEVGYARMLRSDYTPEMVASFRDKIHKYIVPIATELKKRQAQRIGLDTLYYYDEPFQFASGNPKPKGSPSWILENAQQMYKELSVETKEFFNYMLHNNLIDLEAKKGKAPGGYCSFINKYQTPFIFSNFNGTSGDIDVLTHEAGHAFQVFCSRDIGLNEYNWPTFEACEIHSMSMEFFTWPWMELFFKEETEKYKFAHLSSSILFLPYGVAIDEFQHFVYEFPNATTQERNQKWREIEKKYMPYRNYDGNEFLENGGAWQRQRHIFGRPFYYIDYALAQICAFQFWSKDQQHHQTAWADYVKLCKAGGSQSFLKLVDLANLRSPFEEGCIEQTVEVIKQHLDKMDDRSF